MSPCDFVKIFRKDLDILSKEIKAFPEDKLWITKGEILNSGGNLALHLCGNLNHFIGAVIGKTGYVRDRSLEFSDKNTPANAIIKQVLECKGMVEGVLSQKRDEWLDEKYPALFIDEEKTNGELLLILVTHFNYHLGQINYLRRIVN